MGSGWFFFFGNYALWIAGKLLTHSDAKHKHDQEEFDCAIPSRIEYEDADDGRCLRDSRTRYDLRIGHGPLWLHQANWQANEPSESAGGLRFVY
jgi:hypothetical protein